MTETGGSALIARLATEAEPDTLDARIRAATLRCVARWGFTKTTLDDIAREAGCSRATIYRVFPGGKDVLLEATAAHELARFFAALADEIAELDALEDVMVFAITEACRVLAGHEALQYLIQHEPEVVLPYVSFDGLDPLLHWSAMFAAAHLGRFVPAETAGELGEWTARIVVSYGFERAGVLDLTDPEHARRLVSTYLMPGLRELGFDADADAERPPSVDPRSIDLRDDGQDGRSRQPGHADRPFALARNTTEE